MTQTLSAPTSVPGDPRTAAPMTIAGTAQPVPTVQGEIVTGPPGAPGTGPRRSPASTATVPAALVVPAKPTAFAAVELTTILGSTAAYAGGVPGLVTVASVAAGSAAVAGIRRARTNRRTRTAAGTGGRRTAAGRGV